MEKGEVYRQIVEDYFKGGIVQPYSREVFRYEDGKYMPTNIANIWGNAEEGYLLVSPKPVGEEVISGEVINGHLVLARYDAEGNRMQEP